MDILAKSHVEPLLEGSFYTDCVAETVEFYNQLIPEGMSKYKEPYVHNEQTDKGGDVRSIQVPP